MVVSSSKFNLHEIVDGYFKSYQTEVWEELFKATGEVAKEAAKRLKDESRAKFGNGPYAKGWTYKIEKGRVKVGATVYGQHNTYEIAHLLENGHVTRNGTGRTFKDTPGHVHIEPVAQWAADETVERTIQSLERLTR